MIPTPSPAGRLVRTGQVALALLASFVWFGTTARAQMTPVPGTGCADGIAVGTELFSVDATPPRIDTPSFALEHLCAVNSTGAFFLMGNCNPAGPLPNWPLTVPCFGGWTNPPATCGFAIDPAVLLLLGGADARGGKVQMPLPIPNSPGLVGLEVCFQFLCADLTSATPCTDVSAGLKVVFLP